MNFKTHSKYLQNLCSSAFVKRVSLVLACACCLVGCSKDEMAKMENSAKDVAGDVEAKAEDAMAGAKDAAGEMKGKLSAGFEAASEKAKTAFANVEGGEEILTKVKAFFANAASTLSGITDKDSAEAAKEKFAGLEEDADGLKAKMADLPEGAKTALAGLIASGKEHLNSLMEKINENPTVAETIKPKIDALMAKLSEMTGGETN